MADALDLGSSFERSGGSSPFSCTILFIFFITSFFFKIKTIKEKEVIYYYSNIPNININLGSVISTAGQTAGNIINIINDEKSELEKPNLIKLNKNNKNLFNSMDKLNLNNKKSYLFITFIISIFFTYKFFKNYIKNIYLKFKNALP